MRIETVEAGSESFEQWVSRWYEPWCEAYEAGLSHGREDPVIIARQDRLAMLRGPMHTERRFLLAAVDDAGEVVGAARADLPMVDNVRLCWFELSVPPAQRRRGFGTALLDAVRDLSVGHGRTSLLTEVERPSSEPRATWPGSAFVARRGLTLRLESVRRDLPLPVDRDRIERLRRDAAASADGYRIETFPGPVRPEDREQMAALKARMTTDAPLGDLDYDPEMWDAGRVVEQEEQFASMGGTWWTSVARAADGAWAGFTQLLWSPNEPGRLYQEDTLVLREHRGHRLGLLMKLATLERATADAPQARVVTTGNAASNTHMIAINEAMGFRATEVVEEWQADVSQLA